MVRRKRNWHPKGYYHIIMQGNNRQNIFNGEQDVKEYYRILNFVFDKYPFRLFAYCIMSNHIHLLIQSPVVPLHKIMTPLNRRYSDYYRKLHNYTGQIYENRYFSKEILDSTGLIHVSRYIHRNPIETKTPMVQALEHYPYSSFPTYFHNIKSPYPFLNLQLLPSLMPPGIEKTAQAYAKYCIEQSKEQEVTPTSLNLCDNQ